MPTKGTVLIVIVTMETGGLGLSIVVLVVQILVVPSVGNGVPFMKGGHFPFAPNCFSTLL